MKTWLDDTEMEDEGVAELLLDTNSISQLPPCVSIFRGLALGISTITLLFSTGSARRFLARVRAPLVARQARHLTF